MIWSAGFFDGEGSTVLSPPAPVRRTRPNGQARTDYPVLRLSVSQSWTREPLDRFADALTISRSRIWGPHRDRTTLKYTLGIDSLEALRVFVQIEPWLCDTKRRQGDLAIVGWATALQGPRTYVRGGKADRRSLALQAIRNSRRYQT